METKIVKMSRALRMSKMWVVYIMILAMMIPTIVESRCSVLGKCCSGQNNKCNFTTKEPNTVCYCDEFCTKSQDCCIDHEYFCRKQDCILTYWSQWSECSSRCGKGRQERIREIHVQAANGGKSCGSKQQARSCVGEDYDCVKNEVAMLLPTYYKPHRNVPNKYFEESKPKRPSYCIYYYLTHVSPFCYYNTPWHMMKKNDRVCVECDDVAMDSKGHCTGAYTESSGRWKGVATSFCYGSWKSEEKLEQNCECGYEHGFNFIFV